MLRVNKAHRDIKTTSEKRCIGKRYSKAEYKQAVYI